MSLIGKASRELLIANMVLPCPPMGENGVIVNAPSMTKPTNLIINFLPLDFKESQLRALFQEVGPISSVRIMKNRKTAKSKGYGFVKFVGHEDANRAIEQFNGMSIQGKQIKVAFSRPGGTRTHCNLFVSNLPKKWTNQDLHSLFQSFGSLLECRVLKNSHGESRRCGFVRFDTLVDAQRALKQMDGYLPKNARSSINVKLAERPSHGSRKNKQPLWPTPGNTMQAPAEQNGFFFHGEITPGHPGHTPGHPGHTLGHFYATPQAPPAHANLPTASRGVYSNDMARGAPQLMSGIDNITQRMNQMGPTAGSQHAGPHPHANMPRNASLIQTHQHVPPPHAAHAAAAHPSNMHAMNPYKFYQRHVTMTPPPYITTSQTPDPTFLATTTAHAPFSNSMNFSSFQDHIMEPDLVHADYQVPAPTADAFQAPSLPTGVNYTSGPFDAAMPVHRFKIRDPSTHFISLASPSPPPPNRQVTSSQNLRMHLQSEKPRQPMTIPIEQTHPGAVPKQPQADVLQFLPALNLPVTAAIPAPIAGSPIPHIDHRALTPFSYHVFRQTTPSVLYFDNAI